MSILARLMEPIVAGIKRDPKYQLAPDLSSEQLAIVLWHRSRQIVRGLPLRLRARAVHGVVFRGRRVVVEHARQLASGPGLILEDLVTINALSRDGIVLGRNVTIARGATLLCTGVLAELGDGIRLGDRCAVGAGSFLGGQGGLFVGDDVIMGPGVHIFTENHRFDVAELPIRAQGNTRASVSIERDCWIGASATIVAGVSIGVGSVVAAGAIVTHDVPAFAVVAGVPARVIKWRRPAAGPMAQPPALTLVPSPHAGHSRQADR